MQGRRDNIHKARIKIIVNQMGIDKYRELVDQEWELTKNGALKVPDEELARIDAYFAPPQYETARRIDTADARQAARSADRAFDRWMRGNVDRAQGAGLRDRQRFAEGAGQRARRHHGRQDGRGRRSRGPLQLRRDPREPPAESRARRRQADRAARAVARARTRSSSRRRTWGSCPTSSAAPASTICALANARSIPIAQDISHAFTDLDELQKIGNFTINISGCMNACGHHHVGHIGILGVDKRGEEFFQLTLGGSSDSTRRSATGSVRACRRPRFRRAIRKIVDTYLDMRAARRALHRHVPARRHRAVQRRRLRRRKRGRTDGR